MKTIFLSICCSLLICFASMAQIKFHHVNGMKGIGTGYLWTPHGHGAFVNMFWQLSSKFYVQPALYYESGRKEVNAYHSFGLDMNAALTIWSVRQKFYLTAKGGLTAVLDKQRNTDEMVKRFGENNTTFSNVGATMGGEVEFFFWENLSLVGTAMQNIYFMSNRYGKNRFFVTAGLRYTF